MGENDEIEKMIFFFFCTILLKFKNHWDWSAKIEMIEKHQEKKVKKYLNQKH